VVIPRSFALVTALAVVGCVPIPVPLPSPSPVSPGRSGSALGALERLGRFNGQRFRSVSPGSVPPSHVYVLVHGWAPGWGDEANDDPRLRSWLAERTGGEPFEPWVRELTLAILTADPYAVVLAYSWLDDAATGRFILAQRRAFAHTDLHGRWLAEAIMQATSDDFIANAGRVHLIGHSYGARVVTLAALYMSKKPQQITIFDSPDAPLTYLVGSQTMLAGVLRKLPVGSGPGEIFVDNYVSVFGAYYHAAPGLEGVVDVLLAPPYGSMDYRHRHLYPMEFYAQTAERTFGLGWSPLLAQHTRAAGCYEQEYGEISLTRGCRGVP
jgi:hypothetical protein